MVDYKNHKICLLSVISIFCFISVILESVSWYKNQNYANSLFPIFTWSLFNKIPNKFDDYGLLIMSIDNQKLGRQTYFEQMSDIFADAESKNAYFAIQKLGKALNKNNTKKFVKLRKLIETNYLKDVKYLEYKIVVRTHKPFGNNSDYKIVKVLGNFRKVEDDF